MELLEAIDEAVVYVGPAGACRKMTRDELTVFSQLATSVFMLVSQTNFVHALPQVSELEPQLASGELGPVQFETKLNLPGDWHDELFFACVTQRWVDDMAVLRSMAGEPAAKEEDEDPNDIQNRLSVDIDHQTITLDGKSYPITSERAVRWVAVLLEANGQVVSGTALTARDPLLGTNPHKLRQYLPDEINALIKGQTGAGSRLILPRRK
ncbi:MAG: hypothetical protein IID44_27345 [Planctomycetes bacterium]|nr:hypothetical protein [Planctomycetota bacterium]